MNDSKVSRKELDEIVKLIESAEHVGEFHLKYGDIEVRLSRHAETSGPRASATRAESPADASTELRASAVPSASAPPAIEAAALPPNMLPIKSPMVGTFYRAPSPGAEPFVEVGQAVQPDSVVCIIEVMKLMNSIPAGTAGTVRQILVDDAQPVQFGQLLLIIEATP